jgi:TonB-dependent starch-binding outer membrane protein SusC
MEKKLQSLIVKNLIRYSFLACSLLFLSFTVQAQEVKGTVKDETGSALPGVNVLVKGTTKGTVTDTEGRFTVPANANEVLIISFIGYKSVEIPVGGQSTIDLSLEPDVQTLSELVVTGYQTQKRADLSGSVAVANLKEIRDIPTPNILRAAQGRIPGLYITGDGSPNGTTAVNIRGVNTLGNTNPLYIIDGVPTTNGALFQTIEPNSIESFQILKDASAASIYGSRASNGVIIVTTKSGKEGFKVNFKSSVAFQNHVRRNKIANTDQYGRILWQGAINDGIAPNNSLYTYDWHTDSNGVAILDAVNPVPFIAGDPTLPSADTDWQDVVFGTGVITSNTITLSGGTKRSSTMVDLSYFDNKGMVVGTGYKQLSLRVNNSVNFFNSALKIGQNLQLTGGSERPTATDTAVPVYGIANYIPSILPVFHTDGRYAGPIGAGFSDRANPAHMAEIAKNNRINNYRIFGNVFAEVALTKDLIFKSSIGLESGLASNKRVVPVWKEGFLSNTVNFMSISNATTLNWTWSNTLNYQLTKGKSRVMLLAGTEAVSNSYSDLSVRREKFAIDDPNFYYIGAATGTASVGGLGTRSKLLSFFGKGDYIYDDRYILTGTVRYDGSSRFGENNRFGLFPAVSGAWVMSKENFLSGLTPVSNLKLRTGYGVVGNQEIGDYSTFQLWLPDYGGNVGFFGNSNLGTAYDLNGADGGTLPSGFRSTQAANPNLKWESTSEVNVGVDFGFFDQKLTGSFDYFSRNTKDILTVPPVLGVLGEGAVQTLNGATMQNKGWEFVLGYQGSKGNIKYGFSGNFSHFADKITYLPPSVVRNYAGNQEKTIIGQSRTSYFGYVTDGIFKSQEEVDAYANQPGKGVGRIRYKDLNNDGIINPLDQDWLGNANPDLIYGFSGNVSYKNFTLSVFVRGVYGSLVRDQARLELGILGYVNGSNKHVDLLNAWTPQNPDSDIPKLSFNNNNSEERASNYFLVNQSYAKLQNVQFGYEIPSSILKSLKISSARVYAMGENLLLMRKKNQFFGPDPEVPYTNSYGYPAPLIVTFGLDIQL